MSKKRRRRNRPNKLRSRNSDRMKTPKKNNTPEKVGFLTRSRILILLGVGITIALGYFLPGLSKKKEEITIEQTEKHPQLGIRHPEKQSQLDKLTINSENIPPDEYGFINLLVNKYKVHQLIENALGDFRDKRPFRLEWTTNGYSEEHGQQMQPNADAQVFKDKQLILFNGNIFKMYRNYMPAKDYLAYLGKRLIHELVHTYMPCQFGNEHFEEGLAVNLEWELGEMIGLKETIKEKNNPLDFKYTNKEIFAKECPFVSPFEWISGINYFNGNMMWKKLVEKDPDIIKKLLEEIVRSGLKGSIISKQKTIELILKVNPELKELIDSFEFLSDFQLRKPQIIAVPLNFDKSRNGLMIALLKRDDNDCDQVAPVDYYKVRIMVNGKELSDPKVFIPPKKSELIIQEKLTGDIEISVEVKGNPNVPFRTSLHIDNY